MNEKQKQIIKKNKLVVIKPIKKKDKDGRLIYKKFADGIEHKYEDGRLIYEKFADGTACKYKYEDGNLVYKKFADGRYYIDGIYYEVKKVEG